MIRVLIVDDQALIRQAVTDILDAEDDIAVIGEAANGRAAIAAATTERPDVIVMDIRMPELDGIGATTAIRANPELAATRILILTTFEEDEYVLAALRAGASGFIGKGAEPGDITRAVRAVHAGESLLSPAATHTLITKYVARAGRTPESIPELSELTDRESEVLLMVARGRSNQEIAAELFISPLTAKTHVNRIMSKLNAHERAQLVILAYETGLLVPGG